jgi:mRNA export factor
LETGIFLFFADRSSSLNPTSENSNNSKSFSFKCHRSTTGGQNEAYAVNAIRFHPVHGTFVTAGSDGTYVFWDKDAKQRLKGYSSVGLPIVCASYNRSGTLLAYSAGYDWSKVRFI